MSDIKKGQIRRPAGNPADTQDFEIVEVGVATAYCRQLHDGYEFVKSLGSTRNCKVISLPEGWTEEGGGVTFTKTDNDGNMLRMTRHADDLIIRTRNGEIVRVPATELVDVITSHIFPNLGTNA